MKTSVFVVTSFVVLTACGSSSVAVQTRPATPAARPATSCSQFENFSDRYDALASAEQPVIAAAEASLDAHRSNLTEYHAAWAALSADLSEWATKIQSLYQPPEISSDIEAIATDVSAQAAVAMQLSTLPADAVAANLNQYTAAAGARDGAVTRMFFDLGLAKGIAGCA